MRDVLPRAYKPAQLASLTMPTIVIIGENETIYDGPAAAGSARSSIPQASVHILANANHLVVADRQDEVERLVGDFLASVA
jgi:pimeloyl-ACP methyl ester carboxylesterase